MNRTKVLEKMVNAVNDKVKQNWDDGTNVTHDIATIIDIVRTCGLIEDWQAKQLFHEADSGYLLTYSLLFDLGILGITNR